MTEEKKRISLPIVGSETTVADAAAAARTRAEGGDIMSEISWEVSNHPVVLYMKGTPEQPLCGFSHRAAAILTSYGIPLYAVDILADPEKRQAIKTYSDWPTIPQVYVGGEFLGGSDLLMEMHQSGELEEALRGVFPGA